MNKGKVLITGGAGFIGSHTADELGRRGYEIRILDNLNPKTHFGTWPEWVKPEYEKVLGDIRSRDDWDKSLEGVDYVMHLAAMMDFMPVYSQFFDTNVTSTALLYELIVGKKVPIKKVVVASSQFVYGEGRWKCGTDGIVTPRVRTNDQLAAGKFEPVCPMCGGSIKYMWGQEIHQDPPNQYAISKYAQELIALKLGRLNNIPSVAMRYSIVHGPRQSLKNAYSGALRLFTLMLLSGRQPTIYEDGKSMRDFVSVYDVARANADVLESEKANYENFNVGSGRAMTVAGLAEIVAKALGVAGGFRPTGEFRVGDIRHAVSDIAKLKAIGWKPQMMEEEVVAEYVSWVRTQKLDQDYVGMAEAAMRKAGVVQKPNR